MKRVQPGLGAILVLLLTGCGRGGAPAPVAASPYQDPGFVANGEFEMRYGTLSAADIAPDLASAYGIDRRQDLGVLSVSVLLRRAGNTSLPVAATVSGSLTTLLGERRALEFRTVDPAGSVSYLAQFKTRAREPVVLQFSARPQAEPGRELRARITREFSTAAR